MRSIDPSTKCGAVLVSKERKVLSTGYNGPIKGSLDRMIPLVRPLKYSHILHAEENCLLAYNGSNQDLDGSTMYITGKPCHKCLRMIMQKGIKEIVYCNANVAVMQDSDEKAIVDLMLEYAPFVNIRMVDNIDSICSTLRNTELYIKEKNPTKFFST